MVQTFTVAFLGKIKVIPSYKTGKVQLLTKVPCWHNFRKIRKTTTFSRALRRLLLTIDGYNLP